MRFLKSILFLTSFGFGVRANANFVYEGTLTDGANSPISSAAITLRLQVLDPSGACAIYEETDTNVTTSATGFFSVSVGSGTVTSTYPAQSIKAAFANNSSSLTGVAYLAATACNYSPALGDARQLAVFVTVPGVAEDNLGKLVVNESQSSVYADQAFSVAGINAADILAANSSTPNLTQANLNNLFSTANYTTLTSLLAGGANGGYVAANANGTASIPTLPTAPSSPINGEMWFDTTSGSLKYYGNGTVQSVGSGGGSGTVTAVTSATSDIAISNSTTTPMLTLNSGVSANQIVKLDSSSRLPAVSGAQLTNLSATQITAGTLSLNNGGTGSAMTPTTGALVYASSPTSLTSLPAGSIGFVLTSNGAGVAPSWGSFNDVTKLPLSGGTMSGLLILSGNPSASLGAATKQYVDTAVASAPFVSITGASMTGSLSVPTLTASTVSVASNLSVNGPIMVNSAPAYTFNQTYSNLSVGPNSMATSSSAPNNTAVGMNVLQGNSSGVYNTGLGFAALQMNTTGQANTALGYDADYGTTTGAQNVAVGAKALASNTTTGNNVAVGSYALTGFMGTGTTGSNTAMGDSAMYYLSNGTQNTAVGFQAGFDLANGAQNTILGASAGGPFSSGNLNVFIGAGAASTLSTGSNNIIIGVNTTVPSSSTSNFLNIGNAIYAQGLYGSPAVGIGIATPAFPLDVLGIVNIRGHLAIPGTGATPSLTSCTNGTVISGSSDTRGSVIFSASNSPETCTLNFTSTFSAAPFCVVSMMTTSATAPTMNAVVGPVTPASMQVLFTGLIGSAQGFNYHCIQ